MQEIFANGATITTGIVIHDDDGWFINIVQDASGHFLGCSGVANPCDATQYALADAKRLVAEMHTKQDRFCRHRYTIGRLEE